jgi:hypothetical protein
MFRNLTCKLQDYKVCPMVPGVDAVLEFVHQDDLPLAQAIFAHVDRSFASASTDPSSLSRFVSVIMCAAAHFTSRSTVLVQLMLIRMGELAKAADPSVTKEAVAAQLMAKLGEKVQLLTTGTPMIQAFDYAHSAPVYSSSELLVQVSESAHPDPASLAQTGKSWPEIDPDISAIIPIQHLHALFNPSFAFGLAALPPAGIVAWFSLLFTVCASTPRLRTQLSTTLSMKAKNLGEGAYSSILKGLLLTPFAESSRECATLQIQSVYSALAGILLSAACQYVATEEGIDVPDNNNNVDTAGISAEISTLQRSLLKALSDRSAMAEIVYGQPETGKSTSSRGSAAEGKKYIMKQYNIPKSAYRMPLETDSEERWEQWFMKVADIPQQFDIDATSVIFCFTGHLQSTHRPTYGWREAATAMHASGNTVTLEHFFSHVRKQLFVSRKTRQAAYDELRHVSQSITEFPDCIAFSTYLKTLWPKLFPAVSDERAPIQKYEACLLVHSIMSGMFELNKNLRKSNAFVHAWCKVQYNDIEIHQKYLTDSAHSIADESDKLCASYLDFLHLQLRNAQESFNAVQRVAPVSNSHSVNTLSTFPFGREATPRAEFHSQGAGKRNAGPLRAKDRNGVGKKRQDTNVGRCGAGGASNSGPAQANNFNAMRSTGENRERTLYPPHLGLHQFARLIPGRADTTLDQAISLAKQGKCVMCHGKNHQAGPKSCPSVNPQILQQLAPLMKARFQLKEANFKNNK